MRLQPDCGVTRVTAAKPQKEELKNNRKANKIVQQQIQPKCRLLSDYICSEDLILIFVSLNFGLFTSFLTLGHALPAEQQLFVRDKIWWPASQQVDCVASCVLKLLTDFLFCKHVVSHMPSNCWSRVCV